MIQHDISTDIRALRRAARSAVPVYDCSMHVYQMYCEWRWSTDLGRYLSVEEQAAFMSLIAEVLENPQ